MESLRDLLLHLGAVRGPYGGIEEPGGQQPAHRAVHVGVTERAGHPPRTVRLQPGPRRHVLQIVPERRPPPARLRTRRASGVREAGGHLKHRRRGAALRRTPAGQHHRRAPDGQGHGRAQRRHQPLGVPGRAADRLEDRDQVVRSTVSADGRGPPVRHQPGPTAGRMRGVRGRVVPVGVGQQPRAGQRQALPVGVHTRDVRPPGRRDEHREARTAAEGQHPGGRPDLHPVVHRLVERREHAFLDLGPVACAGTGVRRRGGVRAQLVPDERWCHGKCPNPP